MGKNKRIKAKQNQGPLIRSQEPVNYDDHPPIFSLQRLQPGDYCFSAMEQADKAKFGEAIFRRKNVTWREIGNADRHGIGYEKIARSSIKAAIPRFITDEVDHFLAFRFNGMKPMVGYRQQDRFFVLWFDHNFTLYKH